VMSVAFSPTGDVIAAGGGVHRRNPQSSVPPGNAWSAFPVYLSFRTGRRVHLRSPVAETVTELPTTSHWTVHGHAAASLVNQPPHVVGVLVEAAKPAGGLSCWVRARLTRLGRRCPRRSASVVRSLPKGHISKFSDVLRSIRYLILVNQLAECQIVRMILS
jgi:hypothetical protein